MKGYVRVVNLRGDMDPDNQPEAGELTYKIDRTNPVLGNKYVLANKLDGKARAVVIKNYTRDLDRDIASNGPMSKEINDLANRVIQGEKICLQCWCKPLPCHGDVVTAMVNTAVEAKLSPGNDANKTDVSTSPKLKF